MRNDIVASNPFNTNGVSFVVTMAMKKDLPLTSLSHMFGFQSYSKGHQRPWWGFQPIRGFSTHIVCHMSTSFCVVVVLAVHMNHWRYSHHCAGLCFAGLCVCVRARDLQRNDSQTTSNTFPLLQRLEGRTGGGVLAVWELGTFPKHFLFDLIATAPRKKSKARSARRGSCF